MLLLTLATAAGASQVTPAGPVIEGIRIGTVGGQLRLEVLGSERLGYLVIDTPEPPTLSLFFANAAFAFPAWSREFADGPLRRVTAVVLGRSEGLLARLDLEFTRPVAYQYRQSDRWLVLSADVAGPPTPVVVGSIEAADPAPELLATPAPAPAPDPAPRPVASAPPAPPVPASPPPPAASAPAVPPAPSPAAQPPPSVPAPAAAQTPTPSAAAAPAPPPAPRVASVPPATRLARIRRILPAGSADEMRVTVDSDGPLMSRAFVLADPLRLVVDFDNAATDLGQVSIPAGGPLVARVRSSQLRVSPTPVVRVVLDLLKPVSYRIEPHAGGATIRVSPAAAR
jgi:hypothetical protein